MKFGYSASALILTLMALLSNSTLSADANSNSNSNTTSNQSSFCLQSTRSILNSSKWAAQDKIQVQNWLGQVQNLIVNSARFKKWHQESGLTKDFCKSTYAFCIDESGKPVGFHVLNRDTFNKTDEEISSIVESCGPFPTAPNHLPWSQGGMRVEMTVAKEYKISMAPDWPNTRLAALSGQDL
ncbi:hypothetical protein KA183_01860 [bacterium]|nr:hypothetical protein [bacterium]QQR56969.1 MAG: hypothetical protein IPG59_18550 [Candidatus Melainabacteria bacterium]